MCRNVIERVVMAKGDVLGERVKCLDPEKAEIYKCLGYEQSDALKKADAWKSETRDDKPAE